MRKVSIVVTGVAVLLFVGILAWNAEATPLSGTTGFESGTYSLVVKARCDDSVPNDKTCSREETVECTNERGSPPDCNCVSCKDLLTGAEQEPAGDEVFACTCRSGTCCNPGTGKWCCR